MAGFSSHETRVPVLIYNLEGYLSHCDNGEIEMTERDVVWLVTGG